MKTELKFFPNVTRDELESIEIMSREERTEKGEALYALLGYSCDFDYQLADWALTTQVVSLINNARNKGLTFNV